MILPVTIDREANSTPVVAENPPKSQVLYPLAVNPHPPIPTKNFLEHLILWVNPDNLRFGGGSVGKSFAYLASTTLSRFLLLARAFRAVRSRLRSLGPGDLASHATRYGLRVTR